MQARKLTCMERAIDSLDTELKPYLLTRMTYLDHEYLVQQYSDCLTEFKPELKSIHVMMRTSSFLV